MIIYNVTSNVDDSIHDEWIKWMQEEHIPQILSTGKFVKALMSKVLVEEEMGGQTYSVQYFAKSREHLDEYYKTDAAELRKHTTRFADKLVSFRTEMAIIGEASLQS
ncbi:MAG: hypothetical protein CL868_19265 [Cytophagaceae bacterium]|nr:hypothetical protein [Cytophagaceae bacterium]|tara:strand:- start:36820 stop:37140 length:321 start_codon:yes stop_codon:yes gene_type:complete